MGLKEEKIMAGDVMDAASNLTNQGSSLMKSAFSFATRPSSLIAGTLLIGTYISTGGLAPMLQAIGSTAALGLQGAAGGLSTASSGISSMLASSGTAAAIPAIS